MADLIGNHDPVAAGPSAEIERSQCYPLQFPNSQDAQVLGPPPAPLESDLGIQYQNLKSVRPQGA